MAIGFSTVAFSIFLGDNDGELPLPDAGDNGIYTYSATVRLASGSALSSLKNLLSVVTISPGLGMLSGGTAIVEAGAGERVLTYPTGGNSEIRYNAILMEIHPRGYVMTDEVWLADCVWLLTRVAT